MKNIFLLFISALILTGCSSKSDQSYMDSAKKNADEKKYTEAISDYNNLIKEHPQSPLAPEALYQLGTIYQNKLDKTIQENESLEKAVETFKQVSKQYPKSSQAPQSLFMAAFIQANDLKRYDLATNTYKQFLAKYPDNELASAAKDELDNMGMTPEQILEKKNISTR